MLKPLTWYPPAIPRDQWPQMPGMGPYTGMTLTLEPYHPNMAQTKLRFHPDTLVSSLLIFTPRPLDPSVIFPLQRLLLLPLAWSGDLTTYQEQALTNTSYCLQKLVLEKKALPPVLIHSLQVFDPEFPCATHLLDLRHSQAGRHLYAFSTTDRALSLYWVSLALRCNSYAIHAHLLPSQC